MDSLRLLDLEIDRPSQRVSRHGEVLPVSGLSWTLLDVLLAHGTDVVDFDTLAAQVWAPAVVGEDAISQRVKLLRQALGDDGRNPRYIRSVRGRGYQLCAPPLPVTSLTPRARWRGWTALVTSAATLLAVASGLFFWSRPAPPGAAQSLLQRADYYAGIGQASNNERAISLYRQALQADPESAPARRGLSRALSAQGCLFNGSPAQIREALALAEQERQRAPQEAATHALWGYAQDCLGDMRQAMAGYRHAIELDPGDERSRASLAYLQQERGELATALRQNLSLKAPERVRFRDVQVARELELLGFTQAAGQRHARNFQLYPDNVFSNIAWPRSLYLAGAPQQARQALDEALARGTPHPQLRRLQGELALLAGDPAAAAQAFELGRQLRPQQSLGQTLAALHGAQPAQAAWIRQRLQQLGDQAGAGDGWPDAAIERALLLQALGQTDHALAALQQAVDDGFRDAAWLRTTPLFVPLRGAPGWPALLERLDTDIARQRAQVLAAAWRPDDLASLSAAPAAGTR
ncbi:winged helix-turn-helix domain-containing protein [Stenotrophomonas sp. S48]|uniref:winged helix-turn-helix transcriptional regulator n=1 Tax=unclassified Stenotrophomonas TaxID=196198 RepID=UPI0019000B58|nr:MULTISPECIES: winged helix-turn-helix transcriptional regulator [unclassified Stenotrophomonas]MBK0026488.1 winged helix-turn-helix domain-containing protein [Stenotrophomonas sp. S48]MBK0048614.1 winged helix-turn-helix domain-containing protein [Stenotrophomonas sp. S49]